MESLKRHGWPREAVAFFSGMSLEEMRDSLGPLAEDWELEQFEEVRRESKKQRLMLDCEDRQFRRDPVQFQQDKRWLDHGGWRDLSGAAEGLALRKARAMLPRAVWPTRLARRTAEQLDDKQRASVEEKERERLTKELVMLLRKTCLIAKESDKEEGRGQAQIWVTRRHAMGRRPNTLRVHVRLGRKMAAYMAAAYGRPWFRDESDVMEYVGMRLEEPCGKSVPRSVWSTLRFWEQAAELPEQERISISPALKNFFDEVARHPSWTDALKLRSSANRLTIRVVLAWEELVVRPNEKPYVRVFAWFKLLKLWAALRWDDTMGIPPSSLELVREKGLKGKIVRSKTSGEGRRVEMQEFYVAFDCWLERRGWLQEGWQLFRELGRGYGNEGRDFLLPRPDRHLRGFRGAMVKYPEAMAMSRALLSMATRPDEDGLWNQLLITVPETSGFWSEHSERITIISWAAALEVDPDARKRWGRWKPTTDEEYAKTSQTMVMAAQKKVASQIRDGMTRPNLVEDAEILLELGRWLEERGIVEHQIDEQLKRLRLRPGRRWRRGVDRLSDSDFELVEDMSEVGAQDGHVVDDLDSRPPTTPLIGEGDATEDEKSLGEVGASSPAAAAEEVLELARQLMDDDGEEPSVSKGTFVLSVVGRSKRRTLHQIGACYRKPGVHYKEYLVIGDARPVLEKGERLCISCFGKRDQIASEIGLGAGSDDDSGSSLSSSTSLGSTSSEDS